MILGIMQPYFFPYLGYFDLISRCDSWVVFDSCQYTPRSWMTRNRIAHPTKDWMYFRCDVHGSQHMAISEVELADPDKTRRTLLGQLTQYKKSAPFYRDVIELVKTSFESLPSPSLTDMNVSAMAAVCAYLGIHFAPVIASQENFELPPVCHPGQWALEISSVLHADMYINPPGGKDLFRPEEFSERGIGLAFTRVPDFEYDPAPFTFVPSLSILDVLMWNSPEQVRAQLGKDELDIA